MFHLFQVSPAFATIVIMFSVAAMGITGRLLLSHATSSPSEVSVEGVAAARVERKRLSRASGALFMRYLAIFVVSAVLAFLVLPSLFLKAFDPYKVLGIEDSAPLPVVNKAYRKLSLQYHPDRGGDPIFFQSITRAYYALTKEEERKNFEKYGNPEGKSGEEQFGSMRGVSKAGRSMLILGYAGALVVAIAAGIMYVNRPRSADEVEEAKLPPWQRPVRRALQAIDLVAPLPTVPFGVPAIRVPPLTGDMDPRKQQEAANKARREVREGGGEGSTPPQADPATIATLVQALPAPARGSAGYEEWRDFFEPRLEAAKKNLVHGDRIPTVVQQGGGGEVDPWSPSAPVDLIQKYYATWVASSDALASKDYYANFKGEMVKAIGKKETEDLVGDRMRWTTHQLQFRLVEADAQDRKMWDTARLKQLIAVAEATDPRLAHVKKSL